MATNTEYNERLRREAEPRVERIARLREANETFEAIGKLLGISRQRAQQLYAKRKVKK
ncbi:MAG TPA: hypothetical protein VMU47_11060 [Caldimonas sp.]|nr:hypothetical protein [Caldimonas sp.]